MIPARRALLAPLLLAACGEEPRHGAPPPSSATDSNAPPSAQGATASPAAVRPQAAPLDVAIAGADGVLTPRDVAPFPGERFTWMREALPGWCHQTSPSGEYRLPEIVAGGVVLLDVDGDLDQDVFLVNAGVWRDVAPEAPFPGHALFRNDGDLRFTDIASEAGVRGVDGSYCTGGAAADIDGDGDQDLLVTGWGRNFLYVNDGKGRFTERAEAAGVAGGGKWSSSACFFDADRDGALDLYVANYVEFSIEVNRAHPCGVEVTGVRDYCAPKEYLGVQHWFFQGKGDGTFVERSREVGMGITAPLSDHSKGLGVVACDVDDDGDPDLYAANDGTPNFLFVNDGKGHFEECGALRGCAYGEDGRSLAGMGVDAGDYDGDGDFDLLCVNLSSEMNSLYQNDGRGWFSDEHRAAGFMAVDRGEVGFGIDFLDHDHDGDLDLLIANGHVLFNVHKSRGGAWYMQADQLLENDGSGRFALVKPEQAGAYFTVRNAARGLATGDLDGDGDLDAVIVARDEPAVLLRNNHVAAGQRADAFLFALSTRGKNRDAIGAKLTLTVAGKARSEEVRAGSSYASRNDLRVHFGAAGAPRAELLVVRWPDGTTQQHGPLDAGFEWAWTQGDPAPVARRELKR
ncbi:MAG: VCBS repeat-containing protein [Planctomycetes bacterium]|nr:VCBS repeat-containing protein [Planctomycetota bacterium]